MNYEIRNVWIDTLLHLSLYSEGSTYAGVQEELNLPIYLFVHYLCKNAFNRSGCIASVRSFVMNSDKYRRRDCLFQASISLSCFKLVHDRYSYVLK